MKPRLAVFLFAQILLLSSCFTVRNNSSFTYQKLNKEAYLDKISSTNPHYLIDVRTPSEYNKSHLQEALNLNYLNGHFAKAIDTLNRNTPAFIYCQTCHRSPFAAKVMKRKGFKTVYDLKGGFSQIDTK